MGLNPVKIIHEPTEKPPLVVTISDAADRYEHYEILAIPRRPWKRSY